MPENINYESIIIASVVAYILAFYFKNFSSLFEKNLLSFIFLHIPIFSALCISTDALGKTDDNVLTLVFAGVFLLRFFKREHV